ncbi:MAG: ABC transporter permease [Pseudobdellovibrionaceae bacterium]
MRKIFILAKTSLQEMLREKLFLIIVFVGLILIGITMILGQLTFAEQSKILADFGFMSIQLSTLAISLFYGSYMMAKEVEKQTCLLMLSRPISRTQFMLGKFFGVMALNTLLIFSLCLLLQFLLGVWSSPQQTLNSFIIVIQLWFESTIILALALAASFVVRPVLALMTALVIFLCGHWLGDLQYFAEKSKDPFYLKVVDIAQWTMPNLNKMNWKSYFFLEKGFTSDQLIWMVAHSLGWILFYILLARFLFRRKDIV